MPGWMDLNGDSQRAKVMFASNHRRGGDFDRDDYLLWIEDAVVEELDKNGLWQSGEIQNNEAYDRTGGCSVEVSRHRLSSDGGGLLAPQYECGSTVTVDVPGRKVVQFYPPNTIPTQIWLEDIEFFLPRACFEKFLTHT